MKEFLPESLKVSKFKSENKNKKKKKNLLKFCRKFGAVNETTKEFYELKFRNKPFQMNIHHFPLNSSLRLTIPGLKVQQKKKKKIFCLFFMFK